MAHRTRWTELSVGLLIAVTILTGAVLILVFGRVGQLHGKKFMLYVTSNAARGLIRGSEVWLDGQRIGSVRGVDFRPPEADSSQGLVIALHLLDDSRLHIRRNSKVQIRAGLNIIGNQVVYVSSGTPDQPAVVDGDTLRATAQADVQGLTSDAALAAKQFPGIIENVKLLGAQLKSAEGTLGALGLDHGKTSVGPLAARTRRLLAEVNDSVGTVGRTRRDLGAWGASASRAIASADSIRALIGSNRHSLGRFRRDSTLFKDVQQARDNLASLLKLVTNPDSGLGRMRADSAIARSVGRDRAALDSLLSDMKRHPLRYIAF